MRGRKPPSGAMQPAAARLRPIALKRPPLTPICTAICRASGFSVSQRIPVTDPTLADIPAPLIANAERLLLAPADLDLEKVSRVLGVDPRARRRFRRFLLPAFVLRKLEPRGGHRQGGNVQHRSRRRRARGERRQAGVRLFRRHFARRARGGGATRSRAIGRQGQSASAPLGAARSNARCSIRPPTRS